MSDLRQSRRLSYVADCGLRMPLRCFVRSIAPRKHFRVLPTRTRPSLFGD